VKNPDRLRRESERNQLRSAVVVDRDRDRDLLQVNSPPHMVLSP